MNKVQELNLELMKNASFNGFDGENVAKDLIDNQGLWKGAVMTRLESLICLRDIDQGHWNVDTLFITPVPGQELELTTLAARWGADDIVWVSGPEACSVLGSYSQQLLRLWWD